jgi:AraC-like DNA-binding protein
MSNSGYIKYQKADPDPSLSPFIKCFWSVYNPTTEEKRFTILPDGHFDFIFVLSDNQPLIGSLSGIWTKEFECVVPPNTTKFGISFKLLAVDYLLKTNISALVDTQQELPAGFWGIDREDCTDFNTFVRKAIKVISAIPVKDIDPRKEELSAIVHASKGAMKVEEIADTIHWSSRQLNRYFNSRYGLSLKSYCNILRYRASFDQLKKKQLFPEADYADQAHFIKEVKKYSGVSPKELALNKDDKFIQIATLPE